MVATTKSASVSASVRRRVLRSADRFWHIEDFAGTPSAVAEALRRLALEGEIEHLRRGTYWRGQETRWGRKPPPPIAAVRELVGNREAIGGTEWYAANLLRLSTQVPPVPQIAVTARLPTGIQGIKLVNRSSRTPRRSARRTAGEVTLLEALEGIGTYTEVDALTARRLLLDYIAQVSVSPDRLVRASATEPAVVRERLKALLLAAGDTERAARIEGARSEAARQRAIKPIRAWLA